MSRFYESTDSKYLSEKEVHVLQRLIDVAKKRTKSIIGEVSLDVVKDILGEQYFFSDGLKNDFTRVVGLGMPVEEPVRVFGKEIGRRIAPDSRIFVFGKYVDDGGTLTQMNPFSLPYEGGDKLKQRISLPRRLDIDEIGSIIKVVSRGVAIERKDYDRLYDLPKFR